MITLLIALDIYDRARMVSDLQKAKGFKGVIGATRKTTPGIYFYSFYHLRFDSI